MKLLHNGFTKNVLCTIQIMVLKPNELIKEIYQWRNERNIYWYFASVSYYRKKTTITTVISIYVYSSNNDVIKKNLV